MFTRFTLTVLLILAMAAPSFAQYRTTFRSPGFGYGAAAVRQNFFVPYQPQVVLSAPVYAPQVFAAPQYQQAFAAPIQYQQAFAVQEAAFAVQSFAPVYSPYAAFSLGLNRSFVNVNRSFSRNAVIVRTRR